MIPAHPSADRVASWVLDALDDNPTKPWSANELADWTGVNVHVLRTLLPNMVRTGMIAKVGQGLYGRPR